MATAAGFSTMHHIVVNFDSGGCANGAIKKKMKSAIQIEIHLHQVDNAERSTIVTYRKLMFPKYRMSYTIFLRLDFFKVVYWKRKVQFHV